MRNPASKMALKGLGGLRAWGGLAQKVSPKRARFETAPENPSTRRKGAAAQEGPPQRERGEIVGKQESTARPEEPPFLGGVSKGARWDFVCKAAWGFGTFTAAVMWGCALWHPQTLPLLATSLQELVPHGDRDHFVYVVERAAGAGAAAVQVEHVTALDERGEFEVTLSENGMDT